MASTTITLSFISKHLTSIYIGINIIYGILITMQDVDQSLPAFTKGDRHLKKRKKSDVSIAVLKKFRLIFGAVRQQFREVEETCGVTGSQLWILKEVSSAPGIGVSELASRLAIHQSTCSQLVEKLVTKGFLEKERSLEDQRRVGLQLTKQSESALASAPGPAAGVLPDALSQLPIEALETLDDALAGLITTLKNSDEKFAERPLSDL